MPANPDAARTDPDETTMARLPRVLSAGGGDPGAATPVHDHPGDELVFVERGRALVTTAGGDLVGGPGTVFLFPRGVAHDQRNQPGTRSWYVVFQYRGRAFPRRPRVLDLPDDEPARRWLIDLCRLGPGAGPVAAALLLAVLERLAARDASALADRALPAPVSRALRLFERTPMADLPAARVAAAAGVSASHLRALFRVHLGTTPHGLHRRLRLDLAASLLRGGALGVAEVAAACGWADPDYFARLFRRRFGATPRAWRGRALAASAAARRS